jgi:small subunit ribosomal protein S4
MEKQKLRFFYGLQEKQFRNVYERALRMRGVTGEKMLQILETRLDNLVYHAGFALTRPAARQLVCHGHVRVNGRKVSIPSFAVKVNDVIQVKDHATSKTIVQKNVEGSTSRVVPDWVRLDREALSAALLRVPARDEINPIANEQAVVEFYSR